MASMQEILQDYSRQISEALQLGTDVDIGRDINKIVVAGMGGSAWPGDILAAILAEDKVGIPVFVVRDYHLPAYVDDKTLVFAVSYSGNTEETILMYSDALKKNARVIAITSGGKLRWLIPEANREVPLIKIPAGYEPRLATGFILIAMLNVLKRNILAKDPLANIQDTIQILTKSEGYSLKGGELAERLYKKIPLIYTSARLYPAAYVWKISFNETAKVHAFCNMFSEMNHNELSGFIRLNGDYHSVIIRDEKDSRQINKRIELTRDIIKKHGVEVTEILVKGNSFLTKMLTTIYLGMYTSYHLALKNNVNPSSVELQENLKRLLG